MKRITSLSLTLTLLALGTSASAYYIPERSGRLVGLAGAGATAEGKESSILFYNPAGMSKFKKPEAAANTLIYVSKIKYTDSGNSKSFVGQNMTGGNGGNAGVPSVIPSLFAIYPLNDKLHVGVSVSAPYGLAVEYDRNWVGRYHGISSKLKTIDVNPSLSFKVMPGLTLGAGISGQYIELTREKASDFGLRGANPLLTSQTDDVFTKLKGSTIGWGYNLGALYEFDKQTQVGIGFRSHVWNKITEADVITRNGAGTIISSLKGSGTVPIPEAVNLGFAHTFSQNPNLTIMGDVLWMGWSRMQKVTLNRSDGGNETTEYFFRNTLRFALGTAYQVDKNFELRAGLAYGLAPSNNTYREPMIPESNIWTVATGFGYKVADNMTLDVNYSFKKPNASTVNLPRNPTTRLGSLSGRYQNKIHVVGLQLSWKM